MYRHQLYHNSILVQYILFTMASVFDDSLFKFVVQDGNGVKGLMDQGLERVPERFIQPPKERIDNQNARMCTKAPIDLSQLNGPNHGQVSQEIVRAAETLGFFQVVNHGVPVELLELLKVAAHNFFGQSPEKKAVYKKGASSSPLVTYQTSFAAEKEKVLEWRDFMSMVYTNDVEALEHWPMECKDGALEYLKTSIGMVKRLLEILIGNLGVTLEDSKVDALIGYKMVNMNFYPKCPNPELTVGVGRHSDMGTLTVLLQDGIGGLYVRAEADIDGVGKKGEWMEIPPIPGALVINVGDTLQILSNGKYKSAEHRVRTTSTESRVSIPIFTTPKLTEKIAPLPHLVEKEGTCFREFAFGDYMTNFFGNTHEGKKSLEFAKLAS